MTPFAPARRLAPLTAAALLTLVLAPLSAYAAAQGPAGEWQQRLAGFEGRLQRLPAGDPEGRARLAGDLARLRQEVTSWLARFPPAQQDPQPWLEEPAGTVASLADLAVEVGRLRAAITRVAAWLERGGESGEAFYLGRIDVAVTASAPVAAAAEAAPVAASVVTAAEIRTHERQALSEALALAPGVSFVRGGSRNETTVTVRGYDIRQVPIFIDGIPIYTPYDGYADLERFTTFDVAEITVSKGFSSVLYGPNALGGAINIVSRRPSGRLEGLGGASYGTGPSRSTYINAGSRFDRWYLQGGASYLNANTFPLAGGFTPVKTQPSGNRLNAYKRDGKFNVKVGWTPNGGDEYAVSYVGQRGMKGNPPYAGSDPAASVRYWKWPYWNKDSLYFVSNSGLGRFGYVRSRVFYDQYDNKLDSYDDGTYSTMTKKSSFQSFYGDYTVGGSGEWGRTFGTWQTLRAAFHVKDDVHQEHNLGEPVRGDRGLITSVGIEDTVMASATVSLVAGISADRQTTRLAQSLQNGVVVDLPRGTTSGVNPQAGVFYSVGGSGRLRATVSHKTRLPTLKDRYSFKFGTAQPNPDLRPERSTSFETGYQGVLGARTTFDASVFYARIADLIQSVYLAPNLIQQQNIGRASAAGFEVDARNRAIPHVAVDFNYSFLRRKNTSNPSVLPVDAPRHKGLLSLTVEPLVPVHLVGLVEFESGRVIQNPSGKYLDIGSLATVSAKVVWTVRAPLDLEVAATNLTDENYWIAEGYPEPGRIVRANLRFTF